MRTKTEKCNGSFKTAFLGEQLRIICASWQYLVEYRIQGLKRGKVTSHINVLKCYSFKTQIIDMRGLSCCNI
jgi:hypothetical protein